MEHVFGRFFGRFLPCTRHVSGRMAVMRFQLRCHISAQGIAVRDFDRLPAQPGQAFDQGGLELGFGLVAGHVFLHEHLLEKAFFERAEFFKRYSEAVQTVV